MHLPRRRAGDIAGEAWEFAAQSKALKSKGQGYDGIHNIDTWKMMEKDGND